MVDRLRGHRSASSICGGAAEVNHETAGLYSRLIGGDLPQIAYFYDESGNMQYICIGAWGAAVTDLKWKIFLLAYDANNNLSTVKTTHSNTAASARATATYG